MCMRACVHTRERQRGAMMPSGAFHPFEIWGPLTHSVVHIPAVSLSPVSLRATEMQSRRPRCPTDSESAFHQGPQAILRHTKV